MSFKRYSPTVLALGALAMFAPSAWGAVPEGPGWELSAATYPTNLAHPVNEVQEVAVVPGETSFKLSFEGQETGSIPAGSQASAVQAALEALPGIGAGNVSVAGAGANVYLVTFVSALGNMKVAELSATGANIAVTTRGAASGTVDIEVFNIGAGDSTGTITVTDTLPAGVRAKEAGELIRLSPSGTFYFGEAPQLVAGVWDCTGNGPGAAPHVAGASVVTCTNDPTGLPSFAGGGGTPTLEFNTGLANPQPQIGIAVEASGGEVSGLHNRVSITGGGALTSAATEDPVTISPKPAPGGLTSADVWLSNSDGTIDTQAGSHPYIATFVFDLATDLSSEHEGSVAGGETRSLEADIPPGLVGDLHNMPQCRQDELIREKCPPTSMVGALALGNFFLPLEHPVFDMVPSPGEPAKLGFVLGGVIVPIDFSVKTGSNYAIVAHVYDIPQRETYQSILVLWGVPQAESHNRWRGIEGGCTPQEMEVSKVEPGVNYCARLQRPIQQPILTLPSFCGEPQQYSFRELSTWQEPALHSEAMFVSHRADGEPSGFTGCEALGVEPSITTTPETSRADSPTGLTVEVKPPLGGLEEPGGLATADIRDVVTKLPAGVVLNPGQAAGLQTCSPAQAALTTETERLHGEENDNAPSCPGGSKVGTATIRSPLIESAAEKQLEGDVYVLQSNPPEVKLLLAVSGDGINIKLAGVVRLDEQTGQLETAFDETPQLPFSDLKLSLNGGPQAALDTPAQCGVYTTNADFTPWSTPFASDFFATAAFSVTEGVGGGSCPAGALPFAPVLTAGSVNAQAGAFTGTTVLLQRGDGQQRVDTLQVRLPPGLLGLISRVTLCPEPQASQGACPAASQIGHAVVTSGPGSNPLALPQPGDPEIPIYLTGPYGGAPFGLSIDAPVVAGPFDLGNVVTRARVQVDPVTGQVTVATDPLPQIVKGVPTDLRSIYAVIDRQGFLFNPTSCEPASFTGIATGTGGASAALASRFQIDGCRELPFKPSFRVSTQARTSKRNGASLDVRYASGAGQANTAKVDVSLPKQLPSRLSTIQQACPEAVYNANPASCPVGSNIGTASASTPILTSPLSGPVYLVSHGGAAFPDVVAILQGEGVKVILTGHVDIRHGITSAAFDSVPDAPISAFEMQLPEGPHSGLAAVLPAKAKGSMCGQQLTMPTTITGQNGAVVEQTTKIAVSGCPRAKPRHKAKARRRAHGRRR